ncbi:sulfite exporter TauE/SafE family protein [Testudinibacter sp. P27/CKL/0425]
MTTSTLIILIICGMSTNLVSALFGIGGGVLMVPVLRTLFPQLPIQMISATTLTIVMCSSIINLIYFRRQKIPIDIKNIIYWSISMIVGVQIGFETSFYLSEVSMTVIFILVLISLAIKTGFRRAAPPLAVNDKSQDYTCGVVVCGFGGLLAGLTGIGGGSIMAPLIGQLKSVQACQIAVYSNWLMVFGGLGSLYGYISRPLAQQMSNTWQIGYINVTLVLVAVSSALAMSFFSMKLRGLLTPFWANKLLAGLLLTIAIYMSVLQWLSH